jgi:hypothetical protein
MTDIDSLAVEIRREHSACVESARGMAEHARRCGELLSEAKRHVPHGEWLPWLRGNFPGSERTAQVYMRLARSLNPQSAADLSIAAALRADEAPLASARIDRLLQWWEEWRPIIERAIDHSAEGAAAAARTCRLFETMMREQCDALEHAVKGAG